MSRTSTSVRNATPIATDKADEVVAVESEETKTIPVVEKPRSKKGRPKHEPDELILCRSLVKGELNYPAQKTGILYIWKGYGDEMEVEYQDLLPLYITRSTYLFKPWLLVEDETLLEEWDKLKEFYQKIYKYEDLNAVLEMDTESFREAVLAMPEGLRKSLATEIATKLDEGKFDSLQKVQIVDQILGTDLMCMLNEQ